MSVCKRVRKKERDSDSKWEEEGKFVLFQQELFVPSRTAVTWQALNDRPLRDVTIKARAQLGPSFQYSCSRWDGGIEYMRDLLVIYVDK